MERARERGFLDEKIVDEQLTADIDQARPPGDRSDAAA
jgi:hypothetical protein